MDDYIDRQKLDTAISCFYKSVHANMISYKRAYRETLNAFYNAPSVDAVEVVRCEYCKHKRKHGKDLYCGKTYNVWKNTAVYVDADFFCKWGEKE